MSLASQSQQWYPTSVQVTVFQARNLRIKGKNGTNDAYAIIQVAKDKFSTSVVEKCVSPVWKEEANFDLPLFHRGNADRCTLYIIVMHRALVGLDKLLGQAVINLLELHENKSRNKTEWFKLVDKNGKADKDRGEVLLDIQFMRNNITASMFDLSMQEKPRSHIGKLKDKIRGKKSGLSDSASAIVPSVSQVMTDSEEDGDAHAEPSGAKKKSKIKSLFGPKSNLQRNVSQSMSTLGTLPEKNSALSGSRSSGLNVDSPEAKKKFKFLTHKRTDSSDSRTSLGPFSLLNRSKQNVVEQSGVCINGSHVYTEETEPKSSTLSLPNSNQGSAEDVRPVLGRNPSDVSVDSLKGLSLPSYRAESRQKTQREEDHQQAERVQEERAQLEEQQRRREEQDKRKLEEERRKLEEQQKKQEEEERRKQEEVRRAEERRRQEDVKKSVEASNREEPTVTDRLSSLFGIGRKKEEHPAASQEEKRGVEDSPLPGSINPFEEIPLSPEPPNSFGESSQQASQSLQTSTGFPNRTAKVFPVKPRFVAESIQGTPPSPSADPYIESHLPSSSTPNSTNPTLPSESSDMFSTLHSSLAPPNARRGSSDSLSSINEILDTESHGTSTSQKRQAPLPPGQKASAKHEVSPSVSSDRSQSTEAGKPKAAPRSLSSKTAATSGYLNPIAEVSDSKEKESSVFQSDKRPPLPLPDYDELFSKRRHGIQGQVKWDKVISEVNLKQKKNRADIDQNEMSIDRPDLNSGSIKVQDEKPEIFSRMTENQDQEEPFPVWKRTSITNKRPVVPPKPKLVTPPGEIPKKADSMTEKPNPFASRVFLTATPKVQNTDAPQAKSRILLDREMKVHDTDVDVGKGKDNLPEDMQNSTTVVSKDVVSQGDTKTPFKSSEDSPPVKPRQSSLNKAPIRKASNQETLGSVVIQKPQNEAKDTKVLEKVPGTEEINEVSVTTNNAALFSGSIFLKTPTVTKPDLEEKAVQSPAKQLVVEPDPFPNNSFLSTDLVADKNAESQGDAKTPLKSTKESPPVKPRQSSLNKALIGNSPVQEKLGSMVTQKPQNEAKDTRMLMEVSGSEKVNEVSMTTNNADLFSGSIFLKTPTVIKPDFKEKAVENSPVKEQVVELDSSPNDLFLSKDPVLVKDAESQGDAKTPLKSTKESPPVKPRQSSLIKAPIRTIPVQEKLDSMVTQKPQNEAKDSKILEKVSGSEEINEGSTTMTKGTDLFSDSIFVKANVSKLGCEEKAEESPAKWRIIEPDPFPNDVFLSKDPWALPLESKNKSEQRMSEEDLEKIFSSNIVDPFTGFVHNESAKFPEPKIEMTGKTAERSSGAQSNSFTKKKTPPVPVNAANADEITTERLFKHKPKVTTLSTGKPKMETRIQNLDSPAKRERAVFQSKKTLVAADPIPSASSTLFSSLTSPEPQMSATEEGTAQHGVTSGGKTLLRAWVTPSESQSVSVQSSGGGGAIGKMGEPASSLRRPHPVKPLGSESLISASTLQGRDSKPTESHEPVLRKPKVTTSESGPYSQLTQEELITLVVKQQAEISKKDAKILELEEYIDNLLVRVIDEKPSILMSMPASKKAF